MQKVYRLVEILDAPVVEKLIYLDRLVRFYARFLKTWRAAGVTSDGREVRVKFMNTDRYNGYAGFTERIFPIEHIDLRINAYKLKIAKEFAMRNENPRVIRSKEIHKWKRYIADAKFSMS